MPAQPRLPGARQPRPIAPGLSTNTIERLPVPCLGPFSSRRHPTSLQPAEMRAGHASGILRGSTSQLAFKKCKEEHLRSKDKLVALRAKLEELRSKHKAMREEAAQDDTRSPQGHSDRLRRGQYMARVAGATGDAGHATPWGRATCGQPMATLGGVGRTMAGSKAHRRLVGPTSQDGKHLLPYVACSLCFFYQRETPTTDRVNPHRWPALRDQVGRTPCNIRFRGGWMQVPAAPELA